jgi:hypothetical protein
MRRLVILVCGLVCASLIAPAPAQAIPFERPVFLSPAAGQTVSGRVDVRVSSQAPYVRLSIYSPYEYAQMVKVSSGIAEASFNTLGADGPTQFFARSCTDERSRSCGQERSMSLVVDNPEPLITSPLEGAELYPRDNVVVTVDLAAGAVDLDVPGHRRIPPDLAAPFEFELDKDLLRPGMQYWHATACNPIGSRCHGASHDIQVTVHRPGLYISRGASIAVSPNGDGVDDTARVALSVAERSTLVAEIWQQTQLVRSEELGTLTANDLHRFDALDDLGGSLPDGQYRVRYVASLTADPGVQQSVDTRLSVDTQAPEVLAKSLPYRTFYPYRDRYLDDIRPTVRVNEQLAVRRVEIRNASDELVFESSAPEFDRAEKFTYGFLWEGRLSGGPLPKGEYFVNWTLADDVGNTTTTTQRVVVDDDLVVERDVTIRVKASDAIDWEIGRCSAVRKDPRFAGGRLMLSDEKCDSSPYDNRKHIVAAYYRVSIPRSLRPQNLSLQVWGGSAQGRSFMGTVVWNDSRGKWGDTRWSRPPSEWHSLLSTRGETTDEVLRGRRLYWVSFVNRGMQYRIRDYRIETTRAFLVEPAVPAPENRAS